MLEALMRQLDSRTDSATLDRMIRSLTDYMAIYPDHAKGMKKTIKMLQGFKKHIDKKRSKES
jgi:hypothetical protein